MELLFILLEINSSNLLLFLIAIFILWFFARTRNTKHEKIETHNDNQINYDNDDNGDNDDLYGKFTLIDLVNGGNAECSADSTVLVVLVDLASDFEDDVFYEALDTPLSDEKIERILKVFRKYSPMPSDNDINYALYRQKTKQKILEIKQRMTEEDLLNQAFGEILENFSKELICTIFDDAIYVAMDDIASTPVIERLKLYGRTIMLEDDLIMSKIYRFVSSSQEDTEAERSAEPTDSKEPMIAEDLSLEDAYNVLGVSKSDTDTDIVYACRKKLRKLKIDAILALTNEDKLRIEQESKLVEKAKKILIDSGIDFEEM
ncbi:MAG: hypothetical protein MJZ19_05040 [Paludibacteraceae bacterium]|nr:hypothetical protein [Paludibacteraceae bacterium]